MRPTNTIRISHKRIKVIYVKQKHFNFQRFSRSSHAAIYEVFRERVNKARSFHNSPERINFHYRRYTSVVNRKLPLLHESISPEMSRSIRLNQSNNFINQKLE